MPTPIIKTSICNTDNGIVYPYINMDSKYSKVYVDKKEKRWINVDRFGNKDTITLKTVSGKLITRTCQYWQMFFIPHLRESKPKCKVSYKGQYMFVNEDTILED
jgi:hypothetical protein